MIHGFPDSASVSPGEELVLHVSADAPAFRVDFYRCGAEMAFLSRSEWLPGRHLPHHLPFQDWARDGDGLTGEALAGWPPYRFPVPVDWRSGVYVALLVEGDGDGKELACPDPRTPDGRDAKALFVVRSSAPARASMLYKVPLLTYHAYNRVAPKTYDRATREGSWSLYTVPHPTWLPIPVPRAVSLHRPGGGTGGTPSDRWNPDPFDPTPRQTFVHWDWPFIAWLERSGYSVDYCTDLDVHHDVDLETLGRYRLLVSAGHDEYWTDAMRDNVERFVRAGGNAAFFGGNTCWWRAVFDDPLTFRRDWYWWDPDGPDYPENALTGVSFRNGGERDIEDHSRPVGYRVQHADHWVYEGTGLGDGETFGDGRDEYLVGYECDGACFDRGALRRGAPVRPTSDDGTPDSFCILGIGDVAASGWGMGNRAATLGLHTSGGTVFTAATTDWPRLLGRNRHAVVEQMTHNVLARLG